jgi:hypothetical protein
VKTLISVSTKLAAGQRSLPVIAFSTGARRFARSVAENAGKGGWRIRSPKVIATASCSVFSFGESFGAFSVRAGPY